MDQCIRATSCISVRSAIYCAAQPKQHIQKYHMHHCICHHQYPAIGNTVQVLVNLRLVNLRHSPGVFPTNPGSRFHHNHIFVQYCKPLTNPYCPPSHFWLSVVYGINFVILIVLLVEMYTISSSVIIAIENVIRPTFVTLFAIINSEQERMWCFKVSVWEIFVEFEAVSMVKIASGSSLLHFE